MFDSVQCTIHTYESLETCCRADVIRSLMILLYVLNDPGISTYRPAGLPSLSWTRCFMN